MRETTCDTSVTKSREQRVALLHCLQLEPLKCGFWTRTRGLQLQWQGPDPHELTGKREASLHSNQHVPRLWACLDYGRTALSHAYTPREPSYLMVCSAFHHFVQQRPMCRSHTVPVCHCLCLRDCFSGHRAHAHTSNDAN